MPFITRSQRSLIDPVLDSAMRGITLALRDENHEPHKPGVLAYITYRTMLHFIGERGWGNLTRCWSDVVLGAGAYFKRELIDPYEDDKKAENGAIHLSLPTPKKGNTNA